MGRPESGDLLGQISHGGDGGAQGDLDLLRCALTDEQIVLLAQVADDGVVEVIAAVAHAGSLDHLTGGQHGDVRHTSAHIHHHAAVGLLEVHAHAHSGGDGTIQQLGTLGARVEEDADQAALFRLVHAGGNGQHHAGTAEEALADDHAHEVAEHGVGQLKVADHALAQRAQRQHIAGRAADHSIGLRAHSQHLLAHALNGDYCRLAQHDALALLINQHVGRAQINTQIAYLRHITNLVKVISS